MTSLVKTNLHPPQSPSDFVLRERLESLLDQGIDQPLTLVSAPAGYGKSTVVSHWLASRREPSGWVSMQHSVDLQVFVEHLIAALEADTPELFPDTRALLTAPTLPAPTTLATSFVNEMDAVSSRLILVLDDYHVVTDPAVHVFLRFVSQHSPPCLHLLIITRRDPPLPVATLRARGQVTELRAEDLAFTTAEARAFLANTGTSVDSALVSELTTILEGWPAGLRLASLALRRRVDPQQFVAHLPEGLHEIERYIVGDVLDGQPPPLQAWLFKTSILDRLCAPLCEAVCRPGETGDASDLDGATFLEDVAAQNLFLIPLDASGAWFRYHHMFQRCLQQRLEQIAGPTEVATLHRRASDWHMGVHDVEGAIQHALLAGDEDRAAEVVAQNRLAAFNGDDWHMIERWLSLLPEAARKRRPDVMLTGAWLCHLRMQHVAIPEILDAVASRLEDDPERGPLRGEMAHLRAAAMFYSDVATSNSPTATTEVLRLEELARAGTSDEQPLLRGEIDLTWGLVQQTAGRGEEAIRSFRRLLAGDPPLPAVRRVRILAAMSMMQLIMGDAGGAQVTARQGFRAVTDAGLVYSQTWCRYLLGLGHLLRNELDAALEHLEWAARRKHHGHHREAVDALAALAFARHLRQQPEGAHAALAELLEYVVEIPDPGLTAVAQSCQARIEIMQHDRSVVGVPPWVADADSGERMLFWHESPAVTACRVLVADGSAASVSDAEARLGTLLERSEANHNTGKTIEILALSADTYHRQSRDDEAHTALERALSLARPGAIVSPFIEMGPPMAELLQQVVKDRGSDAYACHVLAAFRDRGAPVALVGSQPLVEPLTNREQQVLELLERRLRDKEIASELFVSPETVKSHVKHVLQKLGAGNRREAVNKARALHLLPAA